MAQKLPWSYYHVIGIKQLMKVSIRQSRGVLPDKAPYQNHLKYLCNSDVCFCIYPQGCVFLSDISLMHLCSTSHSDICSPRFLFPHCVALQIKSVHRMAFLLPDKATCMVAAIIIPQRVSYSYRANMTCMTTILCCSNPIAIDIQLLLNSAGRHELAATHICVIIFVAIDSSILNSHMIITHNSIQLANYL